MELSKEAINEFKEIWKDELHYEISDEEANSSGVKLLELIKLIIKPNDGDTKQL